MNHSLFLWLLSNFGMLNFRFVIQAKGCSFQCEKNQKHREPFDGSRTRCVDYRQLQSATRGTPWTPETRLIMNLNLCYEGVSTIDTDPLQGFPISLLLKFFA